MKYHYNKFRCEGEGSVELVEASRRLSSMDEIARPMKSGVHTLSNGRALLYRLRSVYQQYTGYEFDRLPDNERTWLAEKIESIHDVQASPARQKQIAKLLVESEAWDKFMAKRFGQVKRYGLEGAESMIIAIDTMFQVAAGSVKHSVIAMPHRGRLNLMIGLLGYPPEAIFHKLQGNSELPFEGSADVLSHLSLQNEIRPGMKATLLPNSSHLESVNPVAQGFAYGLLNELETTEVLPIQIHGDAAFNGQVTFMRCHILSYSTRMVIGSYDGDVADGQFGRFQCRRDNPLDRQQPTRFHNSKLTRPFLLNSHRPRTHPKGSRVPCKCGSARGCGKVCCTGFCLSAAVWEGCVYRFGWV